MVSVLNRFPPSFCLFYSVLSQVFFVFNLLLPLSMITSVAKFAIGKFQIPSEIDYLNLNDRNVMVNGDIKEGPV